MAITQDFNVNINASSVLNSLIDDGIMVHATKIGDNGYDIILKSKSGIMTGTGETPDKAISNLIFNLMNLP